MENDNDLRDRVRAMASEDASAAPAYHRPSNAVPRRSAPRRLLYAAGSLAAGVVLLGIGLVFGTSTGYASARVEGERRRDAISATTQDVTRQLDALQRELVRTRRSLAKLAAAKGTPAHVSLVAAELDVDSMRANVTRLLRHMDMRNDSLAPPLLALRRTLPMKNPLTALTCAAILSQPVQAQAQQGIPVVNLPAATVRSTQTLGSVLNLHQAPDGKVVVNDAGRRQIKVFDANLASATIAIDSTPGTANSYGAIATTMLPYLADSLLFPDFSSRTMLVLDPHGQVTHTLALPVVQHLGSIGRDVSTTDNRGRVIYRGMWAAQTQNVVVGPIFPDSAPLLRADFDLRRVDTIGMIARPVAKVAATTPDGKSVITQWGVDPVATVDNWSVLADGSVAIVRGRDYHIDWVRPNGATATTGKLPFDWKRISDDDKRRIWDSTHTALLEGFANGSHRAFAMTSLPANFDPNQAPAPGAGGRGGRGDGAGDGKPCGIGCGVDMKTLILRSDVIPLDKIADFYPPMRINATMADADGNLWILPTTSAQSQHGELVYDVVNANGELTERVRVPLGRLVVGFGKGGVVYMTAGDKATGFYLERSKLPRASNAQPK